MRHIVRGNAAIAERVTLEEIIAADPRVTLENTSTLVNYFVYAPGQSVAWDKYLVVLGHLLPIGGKPAQKFYPEAEFEIIVGALDPRMKPAADNFKSWGILEPLNVGLHFHGPSVSGAKKLLDELIELVCAGALWVETQGVRVGPGGFMSMLEYWQHHGAQKMLGILSVEGRPDGRVEINYKKAAEVKFGLGPGEMKC